MGEGAPPERPLRGLVARTVAREIELGRDAVRRSGRALRGLLARRPPAPRTAAILFSVALLACGAFSVVAQARLPRRLPTSRDWAAVASVLERDGRPGDAVALSPPWAERAREVLPASIPVVASASYADEDLVGVRRLWVLSAPDAPGFSRDPELEVLERASRSDPPERIGAFELVRYDLAFPLVPLAFLPDRLALAQVSRGGKPCPPDARGAFHCDGDAPARIAREVREVGDAPRPCLVAALASGAPVTVEFPPVRVGRILRGHVGPLGGGREPVRVSVLVEGEEAGAAEIAGDGYVPFQVDTTRFGGATRPVALVLTTPGAAEVCLDAVLLP